MRHYFEVGLLSVHVLRLLISCVQETLSEYGETAESAFSAYSAADLNTLGDISPDAL